MKSGAKRWEIYPTNKSLSSHFSEKLGISPLTSQILINRDITDLEQARVFLSSSLSNLHSPFLMADMEKAVNRIIDAIMQKEKILIYGDYDVDGITGTSALMIFLEKIGGLVNYYLPQRLKEGYGLNCEAIEKIGSMGVKLIITVDCGISDLQEVSLANEKRMDVIITDHHEPPDLLPPACAIINPKRKDCAFPFKFLAGAGVVLNLIIALRKSLKERNFWGDKNPPNLKKYLDLIALGTIADIVPLVNENRIFAHFGLQQLRETEKIGISALKEVSGLNGNKVIDAGMVGFRLAPRINAAGRMGNAEAGVKLFTSRNEMEAEKIARMLNKKNGERQRIEEEVVREAKKMVEEDPSLLEGKSLVLAGNNWHPGVIGIGASRLVDAYDRPVVLIALDKEKGEGKGSARSIPAFHLYDSLKKCASHLINFGGHKYAAGLSIREEKIDDFSRAFGDIAREMLSDGDLSPVIEIDAEIELEEISFKAVTEMEKLAPFGYGNPDPVLASREVEVKNSLVVGNNHLKMKVRDNKITYDVIGFNMADDLPPAGSRVRIAFSPQFNEWRGARSIQLKLKDLKII